MLSRDEKNALHGFINDLLVAGNVVSVASSARKSSDFTLMRKFRQECRTICYECLNQKFDFAAVDQALESLINGKFKFTPDVHFN